MDDNSGTDNLDSQRIVFVTHMGDIVDINNHYQWQIVRENMDRFHCRKLMIIHTFLN